MSTILRIGSLMKVGFGSAGVEIIQKGLEKGSGGSKLFLNQNGSIVSCIFLFCDIRQFTDATECLQEEVFVFTNKVAAIIHSICHAYGGSANKNVGDAFLMSWSLEDSEGEEDVSETVGDRFIPSGGGSMFGASGNQLSANSKQADRALLSVVKISIALCHDQFILESLTEEPQKRLLAKIAKRKGPVVQMGFGLHAGTAVQGAIGSQRKLDATYVGEHVEMAEYLESSTKKYGLKMLMSDSFHQLLKLRLQCRCRKVDQVMFDDDDGINDADAIKDGKIMELYTFDMDVDALWKPTKVNVSSGGIENSSGALFHGSRHHGTNDKSLENILSKFGISRRFSFAKGTGAAFTGGSGNYSVDGSVYKPGLSIGEPEEASPQPDIILNNRGVPEKMPTDLKLPTEPTTYDQSVWRNDRELVAIWKKYADGSFYQDFSNGLESYFLPDWKDARQCFQNILEHSEDGPSRYFLNKIEESNGIPPRNFTGYGDA